MNSERLSYLPVAPEDLDAFHRLVQDPHIRRYLLDGNLFDRDWAGARIQSSQALFQQRGVGLWLAYEKSSGRLIGFCGYLQFAELHPEPQLIYAMTETFTGLGYATEMGGAAIAHARAQSGFAVIHGSVDAVNAASLRVLEKLGFQRVSTVQGSFGDLYMLQLPCESRSDPMG